MLSTDRLSYLHVQKTTLSYLYFRFEMDRNIINYSQLFFISCKSEAEFKYFRFLGKLEETFSIQWGWGIRGQKITGQSTSDWLKMTSQRSSKPKSGYLSRFWTMKIGGKWSKKLVLPEYLLIISKIYIHQFY